MSGAPNSNQQSRSLRWLSLFPIHIVLVLLAIIWIMPSIGLLITSFRPQREIASSGWWNLQNVADNITSQNYEMVLTNRPTADQPPLPDPNFFHTFLNSLIITIPSTIMPIMFAALAAYAFSWLDFTGRNFLYLLIILLLIVPLQVTWVPMLKIFNPLGLTRSYFGIWIAHTAYGTPFAVFLLRNFFAELPRDLFDSARVDGASELTIFSRIALPLSTPALASLGIFQFVWVWNDLVNGKIYISDPDKIPLTRGIERLLLQFGGQWHILSAASFISLLVPLLIFFSLQRYFVRGITAGAVKG